MLGKGRSPVDRQTEYPEPEALICPQKCTFYGQVHPTEGATLSAGEVKHAWALMASSGYFWRFVGGQGICSSICQYFIAASHSAYLSE